MFPMKEENSIFRPTIGEPILRTERFFIWYECFGTLNNLYAETGFDLPFKRIDPSP
jgi:hypothetical protein